MNCLPAPLIVDAVDRNNDGAIGQDEVIGDAWLLVRESIRIVDQDGDNKISPEELRNAANPGTISRAYMKFYDANADGELRFEDLKFLQNRQDDLGRIISHMGSALYDAITLAFLAFLDDMPPLPPILQCSGGL